MRLKARLQTLLAAMCMLAAILPMLLVLLVNYREGVETPGAMAPGGPYWHRLWLYLAVLGLGLGIALVLGRTLAGVIHRRLEDLRRAGEHLARGEFNARVAPAPGVAVAELEQVTDGLGRLADRLAEIQVSMSDAKLNLEGRVAQRTQELAQRNVDLGYSRATLYAVMESMTDGLVLITPDRRIRYTNGKTEALLVLGGEFHPGRPAEELYAAIAGACTDPAAAREELRRTSGTTVLTVPSANPALRYLRWRTFPIRNATGANLGLGHILTDVTREHELDRVKSELISTVSHELRTPLTAIRASASSLLRPGVRWDEETRSDFLQTISDESRHLQELIENLLDMSKIEAGVLRLDRHPVDVAQWLEGVVARARPLYPDLAVQVDLAPDLPALPLDRRRMEQVLLNLIDNAVKYGGDRPGVEVGARPAEGGVLFTVRDQGIGIPPDHLDLIFQRFHRVDSKLTRDTGGSGLGLAICRGIVEAHGGRIWAESELGRGSTFSVLLPALQEDEHPHEVQSTGR